MTILSDREKALEDKYILDFERSFKVRARRDKLLAQWAAGEIGRSDVKVYTDEVIQAGLSEAGDDDVLLKVLTDLQTAGSSVGEDALREKMRRLMFEAAEQLEAEN